MNKKIYSVIAVSSLSLVLMVSCTTVSKNENGKEIVSKSSNTLNNAKLNKADTDTTKELTRLSSMVLIPAGEFVMGKEEPHARHGNAHAGHSHGGGHGHAGHGQSEHEHHGHKDVDFGKPAHKVYLDAYYIDKYEVTNGEYSKFMNAGGYKDPKYWTNEGWKWRTENNITAPKWWLNENRETYKSGPDFHDYAVTGISWYEAMAYAKWAGKLLPTEAQWEKAARGTDMRIYPWGNEEPDCEYANFTLAKYRFCTQHVSIVGELEKGKSPYGLYDMAGNVWEWCRDPYSKTYYTESPYKNPQGALDSSRRILRGGSWVNAKDFICVTFRRSVRTNLRDYFNGFRCVVESGSD